MSVWTDPYFQLLKNAVFFQIFNLMTIDDGKARDVFQVSAVLHLSSKVSACQALGMSSASVLCNFIPRI